MKPLTTSILAFVLLIIGIIATAHILLLMGRNTEKYQKYLRWSHRLWGYLFFSLYVFISVIMFQKMTGDSSVLFAKDAIHAYIGVTIFPIIITKICISRFFKNFYKSLPAYGMLAIILLYLTTSLSAGYYILYTFRSQYSSISDNGRLVKANVNIGRKIVQKKCSTCHSLERVYSHVKTKDDWKAYVSRMREKDPAILDDYETIQALGYLIKNLGIDDTKMEVSLGIRIVLNKCHTCHTLERVFQTKKTADEWVQTIERMRSFDPDLLNDSETRQVNFYLSNVLAIKKTQ
ncbi:MAG: hypothetical protein MRJ65_00520 [Candidatus Brocadiaceae bacterium]|nr:hypothetical protein [Candidatus Brocadiaceae bacterium]